MPLRNEDQYLGWVTRALHWTIAALIVAMLGLGTYISNAEPSLSLIAWFGLHKSFGIVALSAVLIRLIWHSYSPAVAAPLGDGAAWMGKAAKFMRWVLYVLMVLVPLSGWVASAATGPDVIVFNRFALPPIAPISERIEVIGFAIHSLATKALMACVAIHIAAALFHHFWLRDGTLTRMWYGRSPSGG